MNIQESYAIKSARFAFTCLYCVGALYLIPHLEPLFWSNRAGQVTHIGDLPQDQGRIIDSSASEEMALAGSLPEGWQANWRAGTLWLTHVNRDGTIADSLAFPSLEYCYDWIETHSDFCDVNVMKLALQEPDTASGADTAVAMK